MLLFVGLRNITLSRRLVQRAWCKGPGARHGVGALQRPTPSASRLSRSKVLIANREWCADKCLSSQNSRARPNVTSRGGFQPAGGACRTRRVGTVSVIFLRVGNGARRPSRMLGPRSSSGIRRHGDKLVPLLGLSGTGGGVSRADRRPREVVAAGGRRQPASGEPPGFGGGHSVKRTGRYGGPLLPTVTRWPDMSLTRWLVATSGLVFVHC